MRSRSGARILVTCGRELRRNPQQYDSDDDGQIDQNQNLHLKPSHTRRAYTMVSATFAMLDYGGSRIFTCLADERDGTGWERTPWHATQRAAWGALKKGEWHRPTLSHRREG